MAYTDLILESTMNNPEVAVLGVAVGFILAKILGRRNRGMGGGGFP